MGCTYTIHIGKIPVIEEIVVVPPNKIYKEIDSDIALRQPHIEIGECSFLKAGLYNDLSYVPEPIRELKKIIPSYHLTSKKITENLIEKIASIEWKNTTQYEMYITKEELIEFLRRYIGEECYSICW